MCRYEKRILSKLDDPLKWKARHTRANMRRRSTLPVPSAPEIEAWLKSIERFVCHYTGVPLSHFDFSIDHKQPLDRGGTHDLDNLAICQKSMNLTKGTMTEDEFFDLILLTSRWEDCGSKLFGRLRMAGHAFGGK